MIYPFLGLLETITRLGTDVDVNGIDNGLHRRHQSRICSSFISFYGSFFLVSGKYYSEYIEI